MEPQTRHEQFLAAAAGEYSSPPSPVTREEYYLKAIADNSGSGFTPTGEQLNAMNSGITAERVGELEGIDDTGDNFIEINGVKLYFGSTAPSNPSDGDWWLD